MANFGASIVSGESTHVEHGVAGGTIAHGDCVYKSSTTGKWAKAQSNAAATLGGVGISGGLGVALNAAISGGPVKVLLRGYITAASSLAPGQAYAVSDTAAGEITAHSGLTEDTDFVALMGVAVTATTVYINPINTGVVINLI